MTETKNKETFVLYAKAGVLQPTRKKLAEGSESYLHAACALQGISFRKVGIVSKVFWEDRFDEKNTK